MKVSCIYSFILLTLLSPHYNGIEWTFLSVTSLSYSKTTKIFILQKGTSDSHELPVQNNRILTKPFINKQLSRNNTDNFS